MKKNFYLAAVPAMMLAAAAFGLAGCEDINNETPGTDDPGTEIPAETPVLTIETKSPMSVTADAAPYTITYTIENAVEGAQVSATCPETWITGIDVKTEGSVGFSVTANDGEYRTAEITVTYTWGDGESEKTEKSISIEQAGTYKFSGLNYGTMGKDGPTHYEITLYSGNAKYIFDIYSSATPRPVGTFEYSDKSSGFVNGEMTTRSTALGNELKSGTLEITDNGHGTYTYSADVTDVNGKTHHVTYTGPVVFLHQ